MFDKYLCKIFHKPEVTAAELIFYASLGLCCIAFYMLVVPMLGAIINEMFAALWHPIISVTQVDMCFSSGILIYLQFLALGTAVVVAFRSLSFLMRRLDDITVARCPNYKK